MKRFLAAILMFTISIGMAGCGDKTKEKKQTTKETPGGTSQTTETKETKTTGDNPPK